MAKLISAPPKFTHQEWAFSNKSNYNSAEKQRASAERLIDESERLIDETDEVTKRTQKDVNKKFGKNKKVLHMQYQTKVIWGNLNSPHSLH